MLLVNRSWHNSNSGSSIGLNDFGYPNRRYNDEKEEISENDRICLLCFAVVIKVLQSIVRGSKTKCGSFITLMKLTAKHKGFNFVQYK